MIKILKMNDYLDIKIESILKKLSLWMGLFRIMRSHIQNFLPIWELKIIVGEQMRLEMIKMMKNGLSYGEPYSLTCGIQESSEKILL